MSNLKNIEVSVKDRLYNLAKMQGKSLDEVFKYYAMERFLYRISSSKYSKQFVLKGALLFKVWDVPDARTTVDIDTAAKTENSIENITAITKDLCEIKPEIADGISFHSDTLKVQVMQLKREYEGFRLTMTAKIGSAKIPIQIDIGFGDVITPGPVQAKYPTLLEFPAPELAMYPPETTIAEKFHAMIDRDGNNSRIKDFYDIWLLSRHQTSSNESLRLAIHNTFSSRKKEFSFTILLDVIHRFASDPLTPQRWQRFKKKVVPEQNQDLEFTTIISSLKTWIASLYEVAVK